MSFVCFITFQIDTRGQIKGTANLLRKMCVDKFRAPIDRKVYSRSIIALKQMIEQKEENNNGSDTYA